MSRWPRRRRGIAPNVVVCRNGFSMYFCHVLAVPTQAPMGMMPPPALAERHQVGRDSVVLAGEHLAGAAHADWISSKTSMAPYLSQSSRAAAR